MVMRLAFSINIHHFFFKVGFMICMYKLLNFPWDLMALQCVNGALIGSHSLFYDGKRTDWFVLCCCHVSEDTLIHCHKDMGFTDSLLGADTSDLIQMNLYFKNNWFHLQEAFCLCRALQKPPCRAQPGSWHRHIPKWTQSWTLSHLMGSGKWYF